MDNSKLTLVLALLGIGIAIPGALVAWYQLYDRDELEIEHRPFIEVSVTSKENDLAHDTGLVVELENTGGSWSEKFLWIDEFLLLRKNERSYLLKSLTLSWCEDESESRNKLVATIDFHTQFQNKYNGFVDHIEEISLSDNSDVQIHKFYLITITYRDISGNKTSDFITVVPGHYRKLDREFGQALYEY